MPETHRKQNTALRAVLACALALRLVLAFVTEGHYYDMTCFVGWGSRLAEVGPAAFYAEDYFCDYPPGYLWVLAIVGNIRSVFSISFESHWTGLLLAVVPTLCDCASAWLVYRMAEQCLAKPNAALALAAFTAFNPLTMYDSSVWKQIDGAFSLPILLCFYLLEKRRFLWSALMYGVALAIKPQALLFGPALAVSFLAAVWLEKENSGRLRAFGRCFGGAVVALLPPFAAGLPFFGLAQLPAKLFEKYFGTVSSYPYSSINAMNFIAVLDGSWHSLDDKLFGLVPMRFIGAAGIVTVTVLLLVLAVCSLRSGTFSPILLAAFYGLGIFTLASRMHERYIVPSVLLALLAAARWDDIRVYFAAFGASFTGLINLAAAYAQIKTDDEFMSSATSNVLIRIVGLAETACFAVLLYAVVDITVRGRAFSLPERPASEGAALLTAPPEQPKWQRREALALAAVTAATAVLSFARLGSFTAPQNPLDATGTTVSELVSPSEDCASLWVYPGISTGGSIKITDTMGNVVLEKELDYGTCFCWTANDVDLFGGEVLEITVDNAQIFELALRDESGALVSVLGGGAMFDEQDAVPDVISEQNSMYFDEIYHGRTAYEYLHKLTIYETTHPPLGKDLLAIGIAIFGMTAFGWRFSGTVFGVMLVPLAWCFARRLTRKPWVGAAAGVLMALDFMRYAQTRIATIDSYSTFFILLGAYFMLWYCQSVLQKGVMGSLLPMALGGVAFGLGCAAKWTGIYAGAGLAVLYFAVLWLRARQQKPGFAAEVRAALVGGVVFYVMVPLCIYIFSYLPYWWRDHSFGLSDWWQCQLSMYNYHSKLEATHPFASNWYTWIFGLRPVWYYQNTYLPEGTKASIACIAGPVICLCGLVCILRLLWRQVSCRGTRRGAGVLVLYGTQLIPWTLVTRCTFLYHYMPSSMFCLAAIALTLAQAEDEARAKRAAAALCTAAFVLFVVYYPALSAMPVPVWYTDMLQILPSFGFY